MSDIKDKLIQIRVTEKKSIDIKEIAKNQYLSVAAYCNKAIDNQMENDKNVEKTSKNS
jgi:hypothetical protein